MKSNSLITTTTHYVGVNDRKTELFEGMWPLPYGISYNSYLIVDEKVTLIETVEISCFERYLKQIKRILGDRPIDYLIINHMEPDHSGSLALIKQQYPEITLVGNKRTFDMIEGFYGIKSKQLVIKEGDQLTTGTHTFQFYLTPMIHWPETMMTYDISTKTIFTGDAFGCYGTLDGGIIDEQLLIEKQWEEMTRYYANIVGKYGKNVQQALKKLAGLELEYICCTHGPVWHELLDKVVATYDKLSKYEAEEGVVIAYGSMYGNTEEMAEEIANELSAQGIRKIVMHNVSKSHPSYILADIFRYNGLIIGSPTYNNNLYPAIEELLNKIKMRNIKPRYFAYFGSFSWAGAAVKRIGDFVEKSGFTVVGAPVEMKYAMHTEDMSKARALAIEMVKTMRKA